MTYKLVNIYLKIILGGFFALLILEVNGQTSVASQDVEVTFNKTSSIVFPAGIISVDRGSRDVLAQKAKGVNNILQLKAGRTNFKETNLTVITADGKLHQFVVRYAEHPRSFMVEVGDAGRENTTPLLFQVEQTSDELLQNAEAILALSGGRSVKRFSHSGMKIALQRIFISGNVMFYHLKVSNTSNIPFHTDVLRFYVKDKQRMKRTASQELSETTLYQHGNVSHIKGNASEDIVIALEKFTIPDAKVLCIELMEKKGGRHLRLQVNNRTIVRARPVPQS